MTSTLTLGPHLTFDEQLAAGHDDPRSCACWHAGRGYITGLTRDQVQHPEEWLAGVAAAYDEALDL